LVGGFGIYNNGSTIQAGFDVNEFWVGSSQANKRKPFIISDGVTYIDDAAINKLTFTKLRDEAGAFVVENGLLKADKIDTRNLTIKDSTGNVVFSSGSATSLQFGNSANLIADAGFYDPTRYFSNGVTRLTAWPTGFIPANGGAGQPVRRYLFINASASTFDLQSYYWAITQGKRYRVRLTMFMSSDFNGFIMPAVHIPNTAWAVPGNVVNHPGGLFPAGHTGASWGRGAWTSREAIYTASDSSANQAQLRIAGNISIGYCEIYVEMFLIEDVITSSNVSTYIANAAIDTAQIRELNAEKLVANTIVADKIVSRSATSFQQSTIGLDNDVYNGAWFYMDHYGLVSVMCNFGWSQSGSGGVYGVYLNIDGSASTQSTGSWYNSVAPNPPSLMATRWLDRGWYRANAMAYISTANGVHIAYMMILRSYR
jgi:hypothetical protein